MLGPVGEQPPGAGVVERLFKGKEGGGVGAQEASVLLAVREVIGGKMGVELVVRRARCRLQRGVGAQASSPNTRAKIVSMRFRW